MIYTLLGCLSFVFLFIFDRNKLMNICKYNYIFNYIGNLILLFSTVAIAIDSGALQNINFIRGVFLIASILFFGLLIYSLFIELPFKSTYLNKESNNVVVDTGTYAICRHPGVIWFVCAYIFLALALQNTWMTLASIVWSLLNVIYVVIQEKYFFVKIFNNYNYYSLYTPMLIPNFKSIKRCMMTLFIK